MIYIILTAKVDCTACFFSIISISLLLRKFSLTSVNQMTEPFQLSTEYFSKWKSRFRPLKAFVISFNFNALSPMYIYHSAIYPFLRIIEKGYKSNANKVTKKVTDTVDKVPLLTK